MRTPRFFYPSLVNRLIGTAVIIAHATPCARADDITPQVLDHGRALVGLVATIATPEPSTGNKYADFAGKLQYEVLTARAIGAAASTNADLVGAALTTYAAASPEPVTKIVAATAAWAAKRQGEFISETIVKSAEAQSVKVLKKFLSDQQVTPAQLAGMSAKEFVTFSRSLRSGNQTLTDALSDIPGAQAVVEAAAEDFIGAGTAAVFLRVDAVNESVADLKVGVRKNTEAVQSLQRIAVETKAKLIELKEVTGSLRSDMQALKIEVAGNTASIRSLVEVSSLSWGPEQKLRAIESNLFPNLAGAERVKIVATLKKEIRRDKLVGELSLRGKQLGQLAGIASALGVDKSVVDVMMDGQRLADGAAAYVSGNYLGAASAVVSMFGGGQDAGSTRHAALMKYLGQQFERINAKLDDIKKLQEETLAAALALRTDVLDLRRAMEDGFKRIEGQINLSHELSRAIIQQQWDGCRSLLTSLPGGYPLIRSVHSVKTLLSTNMQADLAKCYLATKKEFTILANPLSWPATIMDFAVYNLPLPTTYEPELAAAKIHADNSIAIYSSTRSFVLDAVPRKHLLWELSRFALPARYASYTFALEKSVGSVVASDVCEDVPVESLEPVMRIACLGFDRFTGRPDPDKLEHILPQTLIGPMAKDAIDVALLMSEMADLLKQGSNAQEFRFASGPEIDALMGGHVTVAGKRRLEEKKGVELLRMIDWFSLNWIIQQSMTFGDHTAYLVFDTLYDENANALYVKVPGPEVQDKRRQSIQLALAAMRLNAPLARNVVLLFVRKALKVKHSSMPYTAYEIAWKGLSHPSACRGDGAFAERMTGMFNVNPAGDANQSSHWHFRRIASSDESVAGEFAGCPTDASLGQRAGTGPSLQFDGFHVRLPNPEQMESGVLEQPASLRLAIEYRNKVSQALIARRLRTIAEGLVDTAGLLRLSRD